MRYGSGFWSRSHRLALRLALGLLVIGCAESGNRAALKAETGTVPASTQRSGDPQRGYEVLLGGEYTTCGMPYSAWRRVAERPGSSATLPGRRGRSADMPYYLSVSEDARGVEIVTNNCLLCHGGLFNGEPVIGLGNERLDFTDDPRELVDAIGTYVSGEDEAAAWRRWAQRVEAIAPYMITDTVGVNPAPNLTLALIAHRDPRTLAWSEEPQIAPPPREPLPVSVPPWWRMSKRHSMFYNAMGRGDHVRLMMMKSLVCTDSVQEAEKIEAAFTHVRAYIASLEAPEYPFAIDRTAAEQGKTAFDDECAGCHGTYGSQSRYPNRVVGLDTVGTDSAYALRAYEESDRFMIWFNRSWYGELAEARPAPGYVAPPLDGIWATAPYLHNGSVPTIEALLDSGKRPTYWIRSLDSRDFDEDALGWTYRAVPYGKEGAAGAEERARIYDTTVRGYSNSGHTFGRDLDAAQRRALIEYLKTL